MAETKILRQQRNLVQAKIKIAFGAGLANLARPKFAMKSVRTLFPLLLAAAVHGAEPREMSTDRPDTTESPITVPVGHFQIEASFFDYSCDAGNEAWAFGLMNLKAGLSHNTDLQLVFDTWTEQRGAETISGFGDVTLRL